VVVLLFLWGNICESNFFCNSLVKK
jgi:hypothetical protein